MAVLSPEPRGSRLPSATEVFAGVGVAGLVVAALLSADGIDDGPVICPFRRMTGLPCPGCGLTRSWVYLMHGRVGDAIASNPFGPVLIVGVLALAVAVVRGRVGRRPPPDLDRLVGNRAVLPVVLAWVGFGLVRLAWVAAS